MQELGDQRVGPDAYFHSVQAAAADPPRCLTEGIDHLLHVIDGHFVGHYLGIAESRGRHCRRGHGQPVAIQGFPLAGPRLSAWLA